MPGDPPYLGFDTNFTNLHELILLGPILEFVKISEIRVKLLRGHKRGEKEFGRGHLRSGDKRLARCTGLFEPWSLVGETPTPPACGLWDARSGSS